MHAGLAPDATAFILAGGKSTRMGTDKAFLQLGGETLLSRALRTARAATSEVHIVGDKIRFEAFASVVEDIYRERGPLGGIHAALAATSTELNLMFAVDLPFVDSTFLEFLLGRARGTSALVTVPCAGHGLQPLCAVYRREFRQHAEQALRAGKNKIDSLFAKVNTLIIDERELRQAGFASGIFRNLNTPGELESARVLEDRH